MQTRSIWSTKNILLSYSNDIHFELITNLSSFLCRFETSKYRNRSTCCRCIKCWLRFITHITCCRNWYRFRFTWNFGRSRGTYMKHGYIYKQIKFINREYVVFRRNLVFKRTWINWCHTIDHWTIGCCSWLKIDCAIPLLISCAGQVRTASDMCG